MKRKTYVLMSLAIAALISGFLFWNTPGNMVAAQKFEDAGTLVGASEYNARDEFSLTQGGTSGVWQYGYTANDASNAFVQYSLTNADPACGAPHQVWRGNPNFDYTPVIARFDAPAGCNGTPPDSLFVHPGPGGERTVLRWVAPASGTYRLNGVLQRANPSATTDIRILQNETTSLFTGNINSVWQTPFSLTVTVAANDTIDFSVGYGNGGYFSDGSSLNVTVSQPATACLTAPANLQVFVPGENSPVDVQSVNTNASLVGDAFYTNMGKVGRAFNFDGSGDYVRVEDNAAQRPANAVTLEGWFKFDSAPGLVSLISKPLRNSALNSYALYLDQGQLRGLVSNGPQFTRALSSFSPQTGVWHHLAFTYDYTGGVSTLRLYANGVEVTSGQDGTANILPFYDANPYPLLIGGEFESNAPGFFLDGQADEVSVYGRALAQNEIFDIVQRGSFGKCKSAPCAQTPNNLVSWFAGEQNALDPRSNNHGALNGGAGFAMGKVGQAFSLDGVDDFVAAPDDNSLDITGDLTIETWIRPVSYNPQGSIIVSKRDFTNNNVTYVLFMNTSGQLVFSSRQNGGSFTDVFTNTAVPLNQFSHIAVSIQGTTARIFVDGVERATNTSYPARTASDGRLTIGVTETSPCGGSGLCGFFPGQIDELSIYSRGLSQAEIQAIYNADSSGKCKPSPLNPPANQVAWYTADGETDDFVGGNNGTLNAGANYRLGKVGQAFNFDGVDDYVRIDPLNVDVGAGNGMTIETWFRPNQIAQQILIEWNDGAGNIGVHIAQSSNFGGFAPGNFSVNFVDTSNNSHLIESPQGLLRAETYQHIAATYDKTTGVATLYLNGSVVASQNLGNFTPRTNIDLYLGRRISGGSAFAFGGGLDETSIYSRTLSASEIAAVYNAGTAGKLKSVFTSPPVALTKNKTRSEKGIPTETTVDLTSATVTFQQVYSAGFTSQSGVDLGLLPPLPEGAEFTGLAYDIRTTAGYQSGSPGDVRVCFNVPALVGSYNFQYLTVYHLENGVWVDRTDPMSSPPVLCTSGLTSLSPFAIANFVPLAASATISGRVLDQKGNPISRVGVTLTDLSGNTRQAMTNSLGYYSFEAEVGQTYILSAVSRRYSFTPATQIVSLYENVSGLNFNAEESSGEESDLKQRE